MRSWKVKSVLFFPYPHSGSETTDSIMPFFTLIHQTLSGSFFMSSDIIDMCTQTDRHKHTYTHTQMTEFLSIGIDKNMSNGEEEKIEQIVAVLE